MDSTKLFELAKLINIEIYDYKSSTDKTAISFDGKIAIDLSRIESEVELTDLLSEMLSCILFDHCVPLKYYAKYEEYDSALKMTTLEALKDAAKLRKGLCSPKEKADFAKYKKEKYGKYFTVLPESPSGGVSD